MATTRSGSKSPSPAKKHPKKSKKPPTVTSKVEAKMGLKKIAKKLVGNVPETSGTKKRALPVKVDAPKPKRAKISKSARDVSSDSDFEDEVRVEDQKPKLKLKATVKDFYLVGRELKKAALQNLRFEPVYLPKESQGFDGKFSNLDKALVCI
ncbi:uncharacterized protein LOC133034651 [Cannabis sativa]|uniref:uncharacterized protein LOC133034651 n=1 Tax=Cannabis sativa TaxID=3483 RepID=UPI0029C9D978|nr:uncharacterized protein LOC133034651 [Cannabis sativa]XP_060965881.1 uncharacterized protein LOC133034651 [Cannabis sativa]